MDKLIVPASKSTPEIILSPDGSIHFSGRSMNSNVKEFSAAAEEWIEKYLADPAEVTILNFNLEFLSTTNLKFYHTLIRQFNNIVQLNKKCVINWRYEEGDFDMLEKGEDLSSAAVAKFNFIMVAGEKQEEN